MPVADHPVHPRTVIGADHKAHCWNKPRPKTKEEGGGYYAPNRKPLPDGSFEVVAEWVEYTMTVPCQYDQAITPEHCAGCKHIKGANHD